MILINLCNGNTDILQVQLQKLFVSEAEEERNLAAEMLIRERQKIKTMDAELESLKRQRATLEQAQTLLINERQKTATLTKEHASLKNQLVGGL